jgi:hypothetical protein
MSQARRRGPQHERLIPVVAYTGGDAPTPEWLRARAAYAMTHRDEMLQRMRAEDKAHPYRVAERDQAHAAEDESATLMRNLAGAVGVTGGTAPLSEATIAVRLGAILAMLRGVEARCRHVEWPPPADSPRVAVLLSARAAVCKRTGCITAARHRRHDDGRCEVCERESERFTPFVIPLGPCVVSIEACNDCAGLFHEALSS